MRSSEPLSVVRAHALLHFTVLLWGITAIFGKAIHMTAHTLVFYRVCVVAGLMALVMKQRGIAFRVPPARALEMVGAGTFVALHWVLFYATVKEAGIAVAVLCLSTLTLFTALFEPVILRRRLRIYELLLSVLVMAGVLLLLRTELQTSLRGLAMGIGSAIFSAAFGTWNGRIAARDVAERVTFYEIFTAGVVTGLGFFLFGGFVAPWDIGARNALLLAIFSVVCTLFPWLWSLRILKTLSPFTVSISVALEPVYSLAIAAVLWPSEERLTARFYAGAALLTALVILNGVLKKRVG